MGNKTGNKTPGYVVALGAGNGGLQALARFFKATPARSGCAFVVISDSAEGGAEFVVPLLRRTTSMPVLVPATSTTWQSDTIYVAQDPLSFEASVAQLTVRPVGRPGMASSRIDRLFVSLARSWAERSIAIVLSGNGRDGSAGAEIVASAGGLVLSQSEQSAAATHGLIATAATGCVHSSADPAQLAQLVMGFITGCHADTSYASADFGQLRQVQALHRRILHLEQINHHMAMLLRQSSSFPGDESQRIAATTFETQDAMLVMDSHGTILRANRAFSELFGYEIDEVVQREPDFVYADIHDERWRSEMRQSLAREALWRGEVLCRRKDDSVFPCWHRITSVRDDNDKVTHFVAAFADITERKRSEVQIRRLAFFDPLTNLANRRLVLDRLAQSLTAAGRNKTCGALLFLDLDHFKALNDRLGHDVGDRLLVQVAHRLQSNVRGTDTVGRLGGDEFLVIVSDLGRAVPAAATQAEQIANKLKDALGQSFRIEGNDIESGTSIGICLFTGQDRSVDTLLKHADLALYKAKQTGRGNIRFYNPLMQAAADERALLDYSLRNAINADELVLHYQAQVDRSGKIMGAEALIRWRHQDRGLLLPSEFIAHAEDTGLILPLSQWVLKTACQQLAAWSRSEQTRALKLSVNISPRQFRQADFVDSVKQHLAQYGADPHLLALELTENVLLDNPDEAIERMRSLRALGVAISIDDFGTGYSSLSYLKRLPVDQLKIDQSFVRDIAIDPDDAAIVKAIIGMGRSLSLKVYAEGVETSAQYQFLEKNGCDAFQGYLFGKPVAGTNELLDVEPA